MKCIAQTDDPYFNAGLLIGSSIRNAIDNSRAKKAEQDRREQERLEAQRAYELEQQRLELERQRILLEQQKTQNQNITSQQQYQEGSLQRPYLGGADWKFDGYYGILYITYLSGESAGTYQVNGSIDVHFNVGGTFMVRIENEGKITNRFYIQVQTN